MDTARNAGEQLLCAWLTLSSTLWNERLVRGMTFNEALVCNLLTRQAAAPGAAPLTATDLCERTGLLKSQMNKVLSTLEGKGYLLRERSGQDRRQIFLRLTGAGQAAYAQEHENITAILSALVDELGEEKALQTAETVEDMVCALKKLPNLQNG
jgi:DNA-binding MarR family transcriptional regulator